MSASSNSASQPPLNAYGALWGPPLIATFVAAIVYGISVLQTFYYYSHHGKRDGPGWLILVAAIFVLDSAAMGLFMYCAYYYSIMSWGIPEMLDPDVKEFPTEYIITTFLAFIVQNFYINTIRALRAPIIITILLFLTSLTAFSAGLILPAVQLKLAFIHTIVVAPLNHLAFNIARGTALACDVGIVIVLCWLFSIRKTGVRRANNVLDALIMFSVQRGVLQAIVQTGEVLAYAIKSDGIYFLPFHVIVSRIYCNSLLATLNSRDYVLSKGLSSRERIQKIRRENGDAELGNVKDDNGEQIRNKELPEQSRLPMATESSAGRWASTMNATQAILTSFLEPPFLFTSSTSQDGRPGRSGGSNVHTVSISVSEGPYSSVGITSHSDSERVASRVDTLMNELAKAQSTVSLETSGPETPITPINYRRD
ncbi:uncharacterized protein FOMMEDRAFT_145868 [Fomitiporia mediterranea MF3/22]|uniref:uncharacterized protein n=1 Tax=Fomitiporia mediterranea (strain MF3/22) TaxID=694068 RepID=UPI00044090F6|nr:uncharacterized protein FOMMEDRAFT_145868 [Fomitiporia mediterranea MF3/22]EJD03594.1 hypothetical protein FOMMEDRAFT_145868 [Fomitiporia mediterranea MF3/22]